MKTIRIALTAVLMLLASAVPAQAADSKAAFDKLKTLEGTWEGPITTEPRVPELDGVTMLVTLRVTSMGHTLMHEMTSAGRPDDPITMLYLEGNDLELRHYCDAGNRPRMRGAMTPDGKKVQFDFFDIAGSTHHGHMHNAAFTFIDENRHSEDWTFMVGERAIRAHVELRRKK